MPLDLGRQTASRAHGNLGLHETKCEYGVLLIRLSQAFYPPPAYQYRSASTSSVSLKALSTTSVKVRFSIALRSLMIDARPVKSGSDSKLLTV
jgi:hypothetical protein